MRLRIVEHAGDKATRSSVDRAHTALNASDRVPANTAPVSRSDAANLASFRATRLARKVILTGLAVVVERPEVVLAKCRTERASSSMDIEAARKGARWTGYHGKSLDGAVDHGHLLGIDPAMTKEPCIEP
jgi:hypothetical protein